MDPPGLPPVTWQGAMDNHLYLNHLLSLGTIDGPQHKPAIEQVNLKKMLSLENLLEVIQTIKERSIKGDKQ